MTSIEEEGNKPKDSSIISILGLALSVVAALTAALAGFGSRWGLWYFTVGFKILSLAALGGIVASVVSMVGAVITLRKGQRTGLILSCMALALGLATFGIPFSWFLAAQRLPKIHDITTDTGDPPSFVAILALRKNALDPPEYGGIETAMQQREAYPDIRPLMLETTTNNAFDRARSTARRMGWDIVSASKRDLRIEATDTSFWFGFKDDIVVRITPVDEKSRIDVRSVSRVGLSDLGTNAERIRKYLKELSKSR